MLLGGLWHGASWNFLIWGGYHGALLSTEKMFRRSEPSDEEWSWLYPVKALRTFVLILIGWVFFRAPDLPQGVAVLRQMFTGGPGRMLLEPWHLGLLLVSLLLAFAEEELECFERAMRAPALIYASVLAVVLFCLEIFSVIDLSIPFVYFQF
jgi:D-alanyl-lipoteichoic acid acyltransferase DltB (MBOAT superfamily)